jgi:hypothetical protein
MEINSNPYSNVYVQEKRETAWRETVNENLVQINYGKLVETAQDGQHMGAYRWIASL